MFMLIKAASCTNPGSTDQLAIGASKLKGRFLLAVRHIRIPATANVMLKHVVMAFEPTDDG
jgi:hypothetical protein